jgi:hypothetical protein
MLALVLLVVAAMPQASAAPPVTDFCSGWALAGDASCANGLDLQAGQLGTNCAGTEGSGIVGSATSSSTYTMVSGVSVVSYTFTIVTSDTQSFDGIVVQAILNGQVYTLDRYNPNPNLGLGCTSITAVHVTGPLSIPNVIGAAQVRLRIGVYEDGFGDLTWADISNVQMTP